MAWSTRELAELAGTTVKAVRHYHAHDLLDEPERAVNGYKQYGVPHLVRLLQVRRLRDLGLSIPQIAAMGTDAADQDDAIRALDAEIAEQMARLQGIRDDLAAIMERRGPADVPSGFAAVSSGLPDPDRALLLVYSRLLGEDQMGDLRRMLGREDLRSEDFDALPADADEGSIRGVAEQLAPQIRMLRTELDWMTDLGASHPRSTEVTIARSLAELYNPAQVRALHLAGVRADELQEGSSEDDQDDDTHRMEHPA